MRTITSKMLGVVLLLSATMTFTGCSTVDDGDYTAPITLTEKVGGKWVLNSVVQTDEANARTKTLTDLLDFDTFVINLNQDEAGNATTFSIEGNAPLLLPVSGTWQMDHDFTKSDNTASRILLNDGKSETALTVTAVPGNTKTLEYRLTRRTNGQPFVSYTYNLMQAVK
ncbi:MAG: DUF5004 domain-containing protein [Prevotella sp.]|nr:DUF5004 domain-containing protein [Prevotella sp.]